MFLRRRRVGEATPRHVLARNWPIVATQKLYNGCCGSGGRQREEETNKGSLPGLFPGYVNLLKYFVDVRCGVSKCAAAMENKKTQLPRSSLSGGFPSLLMCGLLGCVLLAPRGMRADDVNLIQLGQITVNPSSSPVVLTLQGPDLLGVVDADYGLTVSYHDSTSGNPTATAVLQLLRPTGQYQWQFTTVTSGNSTGRLAMQLGNDHSLTLYNPSSGLSTIVLTPDPTNPQITISGSPVLTVASLTNGSQMLSALYTSELFIPATTGQNSGVINQGTYQSFSRFIHSYGTENLFVGADSGNFTLTTTATDNTGLGANALSNVVNGNFNMAIGANALLNDTDGYLNVAIGANAIGGPGPVTGFCNVAIGGNSAYNLTASSNNLAIGYYTLYTSNSDWGWNTAIGNSAMVNATGTLLENTAIGGVALANLQDGHYNTAIGTNAGFYASTGSANTIVGDRAGSDFAHPSPFDPDHQPTANTSLTTGYNNTFIGYQAGLASPTQHNNATAIGYMATVDADNAVVLGATGPNVIPVNVGIGTPTPQTPLDVAGDATVRGVLRVPAAGDIGMGAFTNGTNPTPAP